MKIRKAGIITRLVILILIVYAVVTLIGLSSRLEEARARTDDMAFQVEERARDNETLTYEIAHSGDPETYENVARSKLGLVRPGEQVFYDVSGR